MSVKELVLRLLQEAKECEAAVVSSKRNKRYVFIMRVSS